MKSKSIVCDGSPKAVDEEEIISLGGEGNKMRGNTYFSANKYDLEKTVVGQAVGGPQ